MRDAMGMPIPIEIADRQAMTASAPELLQHGQWVCLNIEPACPWPTRPQNLDFAGQKIWIIPITKEDHPGVAMQRLGELSQEDAEAILYRLLSVISWREEQGITVVYRTGGNLPRMVGLKKTSGFTIRDVFDFTEIICPEDKNSRIALAFMREARSLNHHGYAFLSYWRVLELAFPKSNARIAWMKSAIPTLTGHGVQEALVSISALNVTDVGHHLFASGRCAIAHATSHPIISPDDPRDAARLQRELPLVQELAVRAIEDRFGIFSRRTETRQHLYELRGWKKVLGETLIAEITTGDAPLSKLIFDLPNIHVRLRGNLPYAPFENIRLKHLEQDERELLIAYGTDNGLFEIRFRLVPMEERLKFDLFNGIYQYDDGSVTASEYKLETLRFFRDYMLNGELQMWNAETGELLSRLSAYLPMNMSVDLDSCNKSIAVAKAELQKRQIAIALPEING